MKRKRMYRHRFVVVACVSCRRVFFAGDSESGLVLATISHSAYGKFWWGMCDVCRGLYAKQESE